VGGNGDRLLLKEMICGLAAQNADITAIRWADAVDLNLPNSFLASPLHRDAILKIN
jgi:hypothetical protein